MIKKTYLLIILLGLIFTGCLTPYASEFKCDNENSIDGCSSVSQNYIKSLKTNNETQNIVLQNKKRLTDKDIDEIIKYIYLYNKKGN